MKLCVLFISFCVLFAICFDSSDAFHLHGHGKSEGGGHAHLGGIFS